MATRYGITLEEYEALNVAQDGRCAICRGWEGKRLHVDHDHDTGRIRGLLCPRCNRALAQVGDDMGGLLRYMEYLLPHSYGIPEGTS